MTIQEKLHVLRNSRLTTENFTEEAVTAAYVEAIAALEKQIPKKPIECEDKYYWCPNCDNPLMHKWEKYPIRLNDRKNGLPYCLGCGQAIDWSD